MNITIITVGEVKEQFFVDDIKEYGNRLGQYCDLNEIEVAEEEVRENCSQGDLLRAKDQEAKRILSEISDQMYVIVLRGDGYQLSSDELAMNLENLEKRGRKDVAFVIGGSLGLSDMVMMRADFVLSISKMTLHHHLMKVVLMEQLMGSLGAQ